MWIVLLSVLGVAVAMLAMALGTILARRSLRGSCGGVAGACACKDEPSKIAACPRRPRETSSPDVEQRRLRVLQD